MNTAVESMLSLYSIMGRLICTTNFTSEIEISLDELNIQPGVYLVVVKNGKTVRSGKVIYQK
jgi:hypothetical protein